MKNISGFQQVYPFATEMVSSYLELLDLDGKTVFTVGSSLDQTFNALVLGAKEITVFDVNKNTEEFYKRKREIIINSSLDEVYRKTICIKDIEFSEDIFSFNDVVRMNNYLQSLDSYKKLQDCLKNEKIVSFIDGNLFHMNDSQIERKYDRMILSNVVQYLDDNLPDKTKNPYQFLRENMDIWTSYLNDDGILQLLYLYAYSKESLKNNSNSVSTYNLCSVINSLDKYPLEISFFDNFLGGGNRQDAIVTYQKTKK